MAAPHLLLTLEAGRPPHRLEAWGVHHPDDQPGELPELLGLTVLVIAEATGRAWRVHPDYLPEPFVAALHRELGGLEHGHRPDVGAAAEAWLSQATAPFGLSTPGGEGLGLDPQGWQLIRTGGAKAAPLRRAPEPPLQEGAAALGAATLGRDGPAPRRLRDLTPWVTGGVTHHYRRATAPVVVFQVPGRPAGGLLLLPCRLRRSAPIYCFRVATDLAATCAAARETVPRR